VAAAAAFFAAHSKLIDQIGISALLALSLSICLQAGQLALAQAAFMGIAAYVGAIGAVQHGWPLWEAMLAGGAAAALAAAIIALPIGRLRGVFLAIATIGFGEIARIVEINLPITGGAEGFSGIPDDANTLWIYGTLAVAVAAVALASRTRFALAVAATREDEAAARGVGIDTARVRIVTLTAGGFVAGLAGVLYAHSNFFIAPNDFGFGRMEQILVACVVGGVTSTGGALAGALVMTVLPEAIRFMADYREVTGGVLLLAFVLFAPRGIAGLWKREG
jgi:branched-chain amino acid transport system permease protein